MTDAFRRAAVRATLAPSVHNSQPWRLRLGPDRLIMIPDRARQLAVHDPTGRQLIISCGCALFNARASLAADGVPVDVHRFPAGVAAGEPCAVITVDGGSVVDDGTMAFLDKAVESRRTNTRLFSDQPVPQELLDHLQLSAAEEGAELAVLTEPEARLAEAQHRQAALVMQLDPAYRTELRAWRGDPDRLRGTDPNTPAQSGERLALITTERDHPTDWLRAARRWSESCSKPPGPATPSGCPVSLPRFRRSAARCVELCRPTGSPTSCSASESRRRRRPHAAGVSAR
ncbi:hypothetical protein [Microlunatus sp. Gsoil 973]|uniref:hypothetical protein n=1 Tax=Microlunatus sp. Gsoil 973 TaxID=2672569 RepID=UPI0012B4D15B|nr:hypothetical protein [Microlunatus sp. Gsoil 973]QGN32843.1 hypothetical protein GJV80_08505 [Microlunatus sp. Gsoil 973]